MKILGIETSCDETAISYINTDGQTVQILGNCINSQADLHTPYGGVFPTLAKREHSKNIVATFMAAMKPFVTKNAEPVSTREGSSTRDGSLVTEEQIKTIRTLLGREQELLDGLLAEVIHLQKPNIDVIAVTEGPGLEPALWVGINFARALNILWNIPIIPMNHMEGHILVSLLKKQTTYNQQPTTETENQNTDEYEIIQPTLPALSLLISGGHTELVLMSEIGKYTIVGQTRDDAVGECFDKTARILGLPYPGGPKISTLAHLAREQHIE